MSDVPPHVDLSYKRHRPALPATNQTRVPPERITGASGAPRCCKEDHATTIEPISMAHDSTRGIAKRCVVEGGPRSRQKTPPTCFRRLRGR